jgi:threonine/homoserine/homoserine lactone efflux protein
MERRGFGMTWTTWWLYVVTETVLSIAPGPAVLFVIAQGLRAGGCRGLWAAAGICSANVVWFALSAAGIGAAILASGNWFAAIKWLGAGYLVYLALRALLGHARLAAEGEIDVAPRARPWSLWTRGVILQLANPKALVFFVALLPQFIDPQKRIGPQILILGVTSVLTEFPVLAVYAALAGRVNTLAREHRFARGADVVSAVLLLVAAVGVLLAGDNGAPPARSESSVIEVESAPGSTPGPSTRGTPQD